MEQPDNDPQHLIHPRKRSKRTMLHIFRNFYQRSPAPRIPNTNTMEPVAVPSEPPVAPFPVPNNMLQNAQKVNIAGNARLVNIARDNVVTNNVTNMVKYDGTHGLEKMEKFVSFTAQFDSFAQDPERICHPGTRQNVLKRMKGWIDDPSSTERIAWIHGPAGAGKSAIAQTLAQSCTRQKVVATFFFYKSDVSRNNGNILFTTLAYQLAFSVPAVKDHIVESLRKRPDLPTKSIETQFNDLIALPFRSLAEAISQQSSPDSIIAAFNRCQQLAPVIIIDGVDECTDEKLQQRFLKIIGNAVKDPSFPFRFLICSRPEAHIEDTLNHFKPSTLPIDLAKLNDANRDIEKYLVDQFSRIASCRGLDPTWPGQNVIEDIVYKSSGNFIFAAVVIKLASDEDNMPQDQLAIILKLKSHEGMSPFAVLDELYLEILRRQRHQDFLKTFLTLLIGRTTLSHRSIALYLVHEDDAKLMNVSKEELYTKLRRMRSLLKFEPHVDVHHRSFLDFLNDPSRSGDYHLSKYDGKRRYLELVVDSIVRYVRRVIQNPDYHETHHFSLSLRAIINEHPMKINLPIEELRVVLRPLVQIQDEILKLGDSQVVTDLLSCDKCGIYHLIRRFLLHLAMYGCIETAYKEVKEPVANGNSNDVIPSNQTKAMQNVLGNDLDSSLASLLTHLQETKLELPPSTAIVKYTCSILRFDCAEVVAKMRSMSDAQTLVDFLVHLIDEKHVLGQYEPAGVSKAARLVLNLYVRIPILPRSLLLRVEKIASDRCDVLVKMVHIESMCRAALAWRVLDQNYIHLGMNLQKHSAIIPYDNRLRSEKWRQVLPLDSTTVIGLMLEVAKAIQYLHSLGLSPQNFDAGDVYLDLNLRQKIRISVQYLDLINPFMTSTGESSIYKGSIFAFGCFFYAAYFNTEISFLKPMEERRRIVAKRPFKPKIPEYAWQLIQRCCAEDRPTIDEVVKEMETWINHCNLNNDSSGALCSERM